MLLILDMARMVSTELRSELGTAVQAEVKAGPNVFSSPALCPFAPECTLSMMKEVLKVAQEFTKSSSVIGKTLSGLTKGRGPPYC